MQKIIVLLLLLFPVVLTAQEESYYAAYTIPPDLMEHANAVIRRQQIEFDVSGPGNARLKEKRVVTILNDKSSYKSLIIHYNSYNKINRIKGWLYDAVGNLVREIHKSEIHDQSAISWFSIYEDSRITYIDPEHGSYPYTVVYEYEKVYKDLLTYPDWDVREFGVGVEQAEVTVSLPQDQQLYYKNLNHPVEPVITQKNNDKVFTWELSHIPPVKYEPNIPPRLELMPAILLSPGSFEAEKYEGSMADWTTFGQFLNRLMEGRDELSPEMKEKVAELTNGLATDREKIDALYKYMQENMRYVSVQLGIGGWQPFSAAYVEENKYGDCKALSNFMKALLKEANIQAWPVLIQAGTLYYEADEQFAAPYFNHMILHVPSEDYWLECTNNTIPPNYLSRSCADRNVVLLTEEGGVLARTPSFNSTNNREENEVEIVLDEKGTAEMNIHSTRVGDRQDWYRQAQVELSEEDLQKELQEHLSLPNFSFQKLAIEPDSYVPETKVHLQLSVPRYASKAGKRLFVPLNSYNTCSSIPQPEEERVHPIVVRDGYSETDRISFKVPDGYHVESISTEDITLETEFGTFKLQVHQDEDGIVIVRELTVQPVRLPADRYDEWRNFYKTVSRADNAKLVLVNRT